MQGAIGSISFMCGTALMEAPAPLAAKQFKIIYDQGKVIAPSLTAASAVTFAGLAYRGLCEHGSI